jgi:hypothetical protein
MIESMEMLPGGVGASDSPCVFISFVHEEQDVAEAVQRFIEEVLEVRAFVSCDKWAMFAGDQWLERIKEALKRAQVVVLMLSRESVVRPWVNFEAGAAWLQGTAVIPVCFKNLSLADLPKPYSGLQAVDLTDVDGQYYLIRSIAHHLGRIPPIISSPQQAYRKLQESLACSLSVRDSEPNGGSAAPTGSP